jgi:hypothetical protein
VYKDIDMQWFIDNWLVTLTTAVTIAAAITAITPSTKDDKIVSKIKGFLNVIALNVGNAKNAEDVKKDEPKG